MWQAILKRNQQECREALISKLSTLARGNPNAFWTLLQTMQNEDRNEVQEL